MQATLDSTGFKHLTRALTCLSKYGNEVIIVASPATLALSSTNSAQSAFGRFKYPRSFFSKYKVDVQPTEDGEASTISAQMATSSLLSIFRHKTNEKGCEKCELLIADGPSQNPRFEDDDEERDSLESRLTVRLHCKHGVIKTHRLLLNAAQNVSPTMPEPLTVSRLMIGPKALRSLLDHFPFGKGKKADPQLVWNFWEDEVQLRSLESAVDSKTGKSNLATELTISAEEFDVYDLQTGPVTLAFHLREFNATIAFAETAQLALEISFSDPAEPIVISVDHELSETLFVIAASQVKSMSRQSSQAHQQDHTPRASNGASTSKGKKRPLEDDSNQRYGNRDVSAFREPARKPMKVVHKTDRASLAREMQPPPVPPSLAQPPPSWAILTAAQQQQGQPQDDEYDYSNDGLSQNYNDNPNAGASQVEVGRAHADGKGKGKVREPLFLPSSQLSQLPPEAEAAIISSGLGIENMTAEELAAMLDGDADELELGNVKTEADDDDLYWQQVGSGRELVSAHRNSSRDRDSFELVGDADADVEMAPTQHGSGGKAFRPLFED